MAERFEENLIDLGMFVEDQKKGLLEDKYLDKTSKFKEV